jgi:hypothetical protein
MKNSKIIVSNLIGTTLSSREQADSLFNHIRKCSEKIIVDFSDINFISRSFADQFYKEFLELNKIMMIVTVNGDQVVSDILNAVSQTQITKHRALLPIKTQSFTDKEKLKKYLVSID